MIGETVGNFQVMRRLGQGGMGEVLLAEHKDIRTKVAIKMLLPHISADKQHVQRFFNEAVAVSKIKHAGIAKIFDVGFHAQTHAYLVMEFLEGESLASRIGRAGRLPFEQVSDIARQIASVLEATHAEGITHRDLKPDNVFLVPDAELSSGERVKVLDFGIAKLSSSGMTQTGGAMGTPAYMSPEQWKNTAKVDGRADVYSLGCLVFEMACGRPPFVADSIGELCMFHLSETPPRARSIVPELPAAFDELVARLLAKSADERPTLREAKAAFAQWANEFRGVAAPTMLPDGSLPPIAQYTPTPVEVRAAGAHGAKPTTLGASAAQVAVPPAARRSKLPLIAGAGVLAIGGIVLVVVLARGDGEKRADVQPATPVESVPAPIAAPAAPVAPPAAITPPAVAPAEPAAVTSRLRIETTPPDAELLLDGTAVANPFDGKFPRADVRHRVEVRAPGHKPESRWVTFDSDQTLVIALDKEAVASKPSKGARPAKPAPTPTTTPAATAPAAGSATTTATPAAPTTDPKKPIYKGTKATIMTDFPTQ